MRAVRRREQPAARKGRGAARCTRSDAACFGQARVQSGAAQCTDGTGAFLLALGTRSAGSRRRSRHLRAACLGLCAVAFVPALSGLATQYCDPNARGLGLITRITRAHLACATLEAIAFQVQNVTAAMSAAQSACARTARASANNFTAANKQRLRCADGRAPDRSGVNCRRRRC